jgi:hypothetical protein
MAKKYLASAVTACPLLTNYKGSGLFAAPLRRLYFANVRYEAIAHGYCPPVVSSH